MKEVGIGGIAGLDRLKELRGLLRESFGCAVLAPDLTDGPKEGSEHAGGEPVPDFLFPAGRIIECFGGPCSATVSSREPPNATGQPPGADRREAAGCTRSAARLVRLA